LEAHDEPCIALDDQLAAQHRCHRVQLAGRGALERSPVPADDRVGARVLARDADVALVDRHEPALNSLAVHDVETRAADGFVEQRLVFAPRERFEKLLDRGPGGHGSSQATLT
jgi:hypothetical protein